MKSNTGRIIFRDTKEPIRMKEKPIKSNTKTTFRNKGTTQVTGGWPMKSDRTRILRDIKNQYEREKNLWQQKRRRLSRTMTSGHHESWTDNTKRNFERQRTDTNGRTTYENTDKKTEDTFREPTRHCEPWEDNPWNQTRHRLFETRWIATKNENTSSRDKKITMKTDTKPTVEHQRDVTNHGKTTHENKRETDFSGDKESIWTKG